MKRGSALTWAVLWLLVVGAAGMHVAARFVGGLNHQTDLMALLPHEDHDPAVRRAKEAMAQSLAQRIVILVGHRDAAIARDAAATLQSAFVDAALLQPAASAPPVDALRALGAQYFPYRTGLLAEADRQALLDNRAGDIVRRARSQIYGLAGGIDARTLQADPFLLLPSYFTQLPVPANRLAFEDGILTVRDGDRLWVLITGQLTGDAYSIDFQKRFTDIFDAKASQIRDRVPDIGLLRLGALFYAADGAKEAMSEMSFIGTASVLGTVLMIIFAFRTAMPLLLSLLVSAIGLLVALSASLLLFDQMHVMALLFGASLIGVTVDYSLHYFSQVFTGRVTACDRLAHVLPGLTLGLLTTLIGYAALALAPFPGLRQIAAFSIIGLLASFLTVVLWFPVIERTAPARLGEAARRLSLTLWRFWDAPTLARARLLILGGGVAACLIGLTQMHTSDDIRRQQNLSPLLLAEQARVQALTGFGATSQFFLVRGTNPDEVLRREEALGEKLAAAVAAGALDGWQAAARFVPSAARQQQNSTLVRERLEVPYLASLHQELQMTAAAAAESPPPSTPLMLNAVLQTKALTFLQPLILDDTNHIVMLDGLAHADVVRSATAGLDGVTFVDPTGDISALLAQYRHRAMVLVALSALLMVPLLAWRYGLRSSGWVLLPPVVAAAATPALLALVGMPFTFFGAMALVLVLSIGVDYAVFCAEDGRRREAVTMLSVALAALTTQLSFGLLAFSRVGAIASFGATVLCGITLAFFLAPLAARARPPASPAA